MNCTGRAPASDALEPSARLCAFPQWFSTNGGDLIAGSSHRFQRDGVVTVHARWPTTSSAGKRLFERHAYKPSEP